MNLVNQPVKEEQQNLHRKFNYSNSRFQVFDQHVNRIPFEIRICFSDPVHKDDANNFRWSVSGASIFFSNDWECFGWPFSRKGCHNILSDAIFHLLMSVTNIAKLHQKTVFEGKVRKTKKKVHEL